MCVYVPSNSCLLCWASSMLWLSLVLCLYLQQCYNAVTAATYCRHNFDMKWHEWPSFLQCDRQHGKGQLNSAINSQQHE